MVGKGSDLSWALGGQGRGTRRGIKLWPPGGDTSKHGEINDSLLLSEKDVRDIDAEGPGYTIKEGLLGASALRLLRDEVGKIFEDGHLQPAAMVSQDQRRWAVAGARGDLQMWLDMASLDEVGNAWWANRPHLRTACRRLRQVQGELSRAWGLGQGRLQAQLACYPGGGTRYVRHLDAQPTSNTSDQRRLTLLYYINPSWVPSDGGCLRLYPHNQEDSQTEMFVDVAPLGDCLLIFQSRTVEHEVLPSHALRFSLPTNTKTT